METDTASLSNLRDIVEPAAIAPWPPAPGMLMLILLLLVWLAAALLLWRQRRRRNAYRRLALGELEAIAGQLRDPGTRGAALRLLSLLLKRVALKAYPRETVAALTGDGWGAFLDGQVQGNPFAQGPGQVLASALVDPDPGAQLSQAQCNTLLAAARHWIAQHRTAAGKDTRGGARE
jgi:hypothetical protein